MLQKCRNNFLLFPQDISNGYVAKEEYTMHTLGKKYKQTKKELSSLDTDVTKGNKDLDALSKLLATLVYNKTHSCGNLLYVWNDKTIN